MRSDESTERRSIDRDKLRAFLQEHVGQNIEINAWYGHMDELGLGRSDRQRLSELRKEGWVCEFDRTEKVYRILGNTNNGPIQALLWRAA